ncbi:MAG: von Willebrand factor type A domain-containing protein [Bacteroidota bacterium]
MQNGSIIVQSTRSSYKTGSYGEFEIISKTSEDSLTFFFEGYEPCTKAISAKDFLQITLKKCASSAGSKKDPLKSVYKGVGAPDLTSLSGHGPQNTLIENPFVNQSASVSFSGGINRTSYNMIRKFLDMGYPVPPDAVQIEGILNYFNFSYEERDTENEFHCSSDLLSCPWNDKNKLLCLNICAGKVDIQNAPPANLVLLIDASGSMDLPNKLPIVKSGIRLLVENLRPVDKISVVAFGADVRPLIVGLPGSEKGRILRAIETLEPDGPTPGKEGIGLAYEVAAKQFIPGGNNKIVLVTDGDITEEPAAEKELENFIEGQSREGINLSCIGVGMGNNKNAELPYLAQKGNGNFGVAGDEQDVEKLLVGQLAQTLFMVANRICVTSEFNSAFVKEYRLIGFENKAHPSGDSSFQLDGSKIGSGQSLFALFELVPRDSTTGIETVADIKVNYCLPGQDSVRTISYSCPNNLVPFEKAGRCLKKAGCIALFGMKLRESGYAAGISWGDLEKMAKQSFNSDDFMDKEYVELVTKAKKIYRRK